MVTCNPDNDDKLSATVRVTADDMRPLASVNFSRIIGPSDATLETCGETTPFDELWQPVEAAMKERGDIPSGARIQRIVADCPGEYVKVWYLEAED